MKKIWTKIQRWYYFHLANPVVREGESKDGAFKWTFRRFDLTVETLSGNFKVWFTAAEHPYGYLLAGEGDDNIHGFAITLYEIGKLITTDQGLVNDIQKAIQKYEKRLNKQAEPVVEDETEEMIALKEVQAMQEHIELPKKERRKTEREIDKRFKKALKNGSVKE